MNEGIKVEEITQDQVRKGDLIREERINHTGLFDAVEYVAYSDKQAPYAASDKVKMFLLHREEPWLKAKSGEAWLVEIQGLGERVALVDCDGDFTYMTDGGEVDWTYPANLDRGRKLEIGTIDE